MPTVLVTGANRGLGLEFVRQYAAEGWTVFAAARAPDAATALHDLEAATAGRARTCPLDVGDDDSIETLARDLAGEPLDLLLNAAAATGGFPQGFGAVDRTAWADAFRVNAMAPLALAEAFAANLERARAPVIAVLSSHLGSIADASGDYYIYRSTKAAANLVVRNLAADLRRRRIAVVGLNPGWVRTDMGGKHADLDPADSVAAMRALLGRLTLADSGALLNYDGSDYDW